jgi:hypothetical protein
VSTAAAATSSDEGNSNAAAIRLVRGAVTAPSDLLLIATTPAHPPPPPAGKAHLDFSMRHDWNSLLAEPSHSARLAVGDAFTAFRPIPCLTWNASTAATAAPAPSCVASDYSSVDDRFTVHSVAPGLQFRDFSDAYYPAAGDLVAYLAHYASDAAPRGAVTGPASPFLSRARRPLHIRYNVTVTRVARHPAWDAAGGAIHSRVARGVPRFRLTTASGGELDCTFLVWAGGLQKVNPPQGANIGDALAAGWVHQYATAPTDRAAFVNKSVLVLGRGNAAFEFANNVLEVAALVHVLGRDTGRIKLALETHYPGDVRSVHSHLLETYLLKSMDALVEVPFHNLAFGFNAATNRTTVTTPDDQCTRDAWGRATSQCFFRREYDYVISCSGWKFDDSPFDADVRPAFFKNGKHPALSPTYESVNVPGLYFAGNLMHSHDFKKSSGGFIHGFRYLVRALHRILEEEEQAAAASAVADGVPAGALPLLVVGTSPSVSDTTGRSVEADGTGVFVGFAGGGDAQDVDGAGGPGDYGGAMPSPPSALAALPATGWPRRSIAGARGFAHALLQLINGASGPYQMFGGLAAVIVLPPFPASDARGFDGAGVLAACQEPWGFPSPGADTTYVPFIPRPAGAPADPPGRTASDAIIDAALTGAVFEDVPVPLIAAKAAAWRAQAVAAGAGGPAAAAAVAAGAGVEVIVLTLEFGTGASSSAPPALAGADPSAAGSPAGHVATEWARDPFSSLRASATLDTPETSHFLHPVLRFYHTGVGDAAGEGTPRSERAATPLSAPVAEVHVIEDFHIAWTLHAPHVLPVLRFVQDVGARRAEAALAVEAAVARAGAPGSAATATSSGAGAAHGTPALAARSGAQSALAQVWAPAEPAVDPVWDILCLVMSLPASTLFLSGKAVAAGEGWKAALSINATRQLSSTGPRMIILHFIDPYPFPPSDDEVAAVAAARSEPVQAQAPVPPGAPRFAPRADPPMPRMTPAQARAKDTSDAALGAFYESFTARNPGVPLVSVNARTGPGRIEAERLGVRGLPTFKVFDAYRGATDVPGADFAASPAVLERMIGEHRAARAAIVQGLSDSFIFPGFDRRGILSMLAAPPGEGTGPVLYEAMRPRRRDAVHRARVPSSGGGPAASAGGAPVHAVAGAAADGPGDAGSTPAFV